MTDSITFHDLTLKRLLNNNHSKDTLNYIYDNTQYFLKLGSENTLLPLQTFLLKFNKNLNLDHIINYFQKGSFLNLTEINELVLTFEFFLLSQSYQDFPHSYSFTSNELRQLTHYIKTQIRSFMSEDLQIDYLKHPKLEKIYRKIVSIEGQIRSQLNLLQNSSHFSNILQFKGLDIINGRYILSIKSDSFNLNLGHVIGKSESGSTLYVEPNEVHQLNTELKYQNELLADQLINIGFEISSDLLKYHLIFKSTIELVHFVDEFITRANFAEKLKLNRPILTNEHKLEILNFFHPLIKNCTKNSLVLQKEKTGLIISGPNTGGKTVVLKSITIVMEFAKMGFFVPASHAEFKIFDNIYFFSSDYQNLESGLSSFSGEISSYFNSFQNNGSSLIVVDEIFKSTSSEEASALAIAFLHHWSKNKNNKILLSTHHQMLKTYLHTDENYLSSHMSFDLISNKPTYHLVIGSPGNSYALKILNNLNYDSEIKNEIIKIASNIMDHKQINYESLLQQVSEKAEKLEKLINENSDLNKQLKNQKSAQEGLWKLKLNQLIEEYHKKFQKIIDEYQEKFENSDNLNKKKIDIIKHDSLKELNSYLPNKGNSETFQDYPFEKPKEINIGQYYYYPQLKKDVLVNSVDLLKNEAQVSIGNFKLKCPTRDLYLSKNSKPSHKVIVHIEKSKPSPLEIDCRGMRLDTFQHTVENAISDLGIDLIPFVTIIHGHGDGVLKKWLREYIKLNDGFKIDEDDSGNDGQTRIMKS